jgi:flavin reductase (DIM6/NTAB) family NADH-FMN oxidoreductase RutF
MTDEIPCMIVSRTFDPRSGRGAASAVAPANSPGLTVTPAERQRALRTTLGQFPTGVTVVTIFDADGRPTGVTVNSFASASLDPPLVLWSLARTSANLGAYASASHHAINVLAAGQEGAARRFATRIPDRFAGIRYRIGPFGVPLLDEALSHLVIAQRESRETGDHITFVGEVVFHQHFPRAPLVFHRGVYCTTSSQRGGDTPRVANG